MTHTYLYILGWLLMWLTAVPVQAQDVAGEDETVGGTLPADTLVRDSLSLKCHSLPYMASTVSSRPICSRPLR